MFRHFNLAARQTSTLAPHFINQDLANPGAKLQIRARKPLPAIPGKVGSDWLPARPWTGGGIPMDTVTIGVKGSAHPSKRAYLAIFASPIPYAFFGK